VEYTCMRLASVSTTVVFIRAIF